MDPKSLEILVRLHNDGEISSTRAKNFKQIRAYLESLTEEGFVSKSQKGRIFVSMTYALSPKGRHYINVVCRYADIEAQDQEYRGTEEYRGIRGGANLHVG